MAGSPKLQLCAVASIAVLIVLFFLMSRVLLDIRKRRMAGAAAATASTSQPNSKKEGAAAEKTPAFGPIEYVERWPHDGRVVFGVRVRDPEALKRRIRVDLPATLIQGLSAANLRERTYPSLCGRYLLVDLEVLPEGVFRPPRFDARLVLVVERGLERITLHVDMDAKECVDRF